MVGLNLLQTRKPVSTLPEIRQNVLRFQGASISPLKGLKLDTVTFGQTSRSVRGPRLSGTTQAQPLSHEAQERNQQDLQRLFNVFPAAIKARLEALSAEEKNNLIEVSLDAGGLPEAIVYNDGKKRHVPLGDKAVSLDDIKQIENHKTLGNFSSRNRAGIENTLHRVSRVRDLESGQTIALTLRVGKILERPIGPLLPYINKGQSVLVLGAPGAGKTTLLREIAKYLASPKDNTGQRTVWVVDTSRDIAGMGAVRHPSVGPIRRMPVSDRRDQPNLMREVLENHTPDVIVIDEIGTQQEVDAASVIKSRQVGIVATAHAGFKDLISDPNLNGLLGGVTQVTIGDDEQRRRGVPEKTVSELKGSPLPDVIFEIKNRHLIYVYTDIPKKAREMLANQKKDPDFEPTPDEVVQLP